MMLETVAYSTCFVALQNTEKVIHSRDYNTRIIHLLVILQYPEDTCDWNKICCLWSLISWNHRKRMQCEWKSKRDAASFECHCRPKYFATLWDSFFMRTSNLPCCVVLIVALCILDCSLPTLSRFQMEMNWARIVVFVIRKVLKYQRFCS